MRRLLTILSLAIAVSGFAQKKDGTVYMVSNAHFDSQWNWDVQTSINEYVRNTLTQNLYLLEKYPDYVFNFEGGIKYSWMKEYYPTEYEKIKEYITNGRWHVSGSSWDATDPNIPSAESFFRNVLLGQQFYKDEFGVKSTDIFLPDCFGFGYTLPTIAAHCGLIGFSTQKLEWRNRPFYGDSKVPFKIGLWQGVDGSRIMAAADARNYTQQWDKDVSTIDHVIDIVNQSPNKLGYRYYGTGDMGGSPTIVSVESVLKGINDGGAGPINVVSATSDQLFKHYLPYDKHPELPVHDGELLMDVHATGCYTSQSAMKLFNRRNEQLADAAERASVVAEWLGGMSYPSEKLSAAWKRFVWHQFHDDLTGTSIPKAYTFSWNDELISQDDFNNVLHAASATVARAMDTRVKGSAVVVYNPLAQTRTDIVRASVPFATAPKGVEVLSPNGVPMNAQLLSYADGLAEIAFTANVAPLSYSVYDVRKGSPRGSKVLKADARSIENNIYKVTLDNNGDICSIVDKREGRELVEQGRAMRLALFTENKSHNWPAWEVLKETMDKKPISISGDVKISIVEHGPARVALRVEKSYDKSRFVQIISLTNGAADDRIDVATEIDWKQSNALLKAEFPMSVTNPKATYDLGIGSVERGTNTDIAYEVYAQQWADLTDVKGDYGVSVINNCKYGWDKPNDNTIRLTLLHTPQTQHGYKYQDRQDIGSHRMSYSIVGHKGSYVDGGIVRKADAQNNPLYAFNAPKHAGAQGKEFSLVSSNSAQIDIKAVKRAEASDMYVVRVYETEGKSAENVELVFGAEIESAQELNGIEEVIGSAKISGNKLIFSTTAFRPKTFGVRLAKCDTPISPIKNATLDLPYNAQAYTNDAFRSIADFDGKGYSYSYDILPRTVSAEGVDFNMGEIGRNNVLKCAGDTITLPSDAGSKVLYLLVASTEGDREAAFVVDGRKVEVTVPYYSGFYGQWGHDKDNGGYVKDLPLAYVGTHRHHRVTGNEAYIFTYMYKLAIPIDAQSKTLVLPNDKSIAVFAATISDSECEKTTPAAEFRSDVSDIAIR